MVEQMGPAGLGILALFFFGGVAILVLMRRYESKRIERAFEKDRVILTGFGINYFGLSTEKGAPARSSGVLVLLKDGIYYRGRFSRKELYIPNESIRSIRIVETHKGRPLYQRAVSIGFIDGNGREVSAAFRLPYPDRWINAIRRNL
jgi:hypothetical protein